MEILFYIISNVLDSVAVLLYFHAMLYERNKKIPLFAFVLSYIAMPLVISAEPIIVHLSGFTNILALTVWSTFVTFLITLMYQTTLRSKIFATISFQVIALFAENIIFITIPASQKYSISVQTENMENIWNCLSKLLTLSIVLIIAHIIKRRRNVYSIKYNFLVLTVPIITPVILIFAIDLSDVTLDGIRLSHIVTMLGLFIINIVNYILFDYVLLSQQLSTENKLLQKQEAFQENKYTQLCTSYKKTRSIVHDTNKHLSMIKGYVNNISNDDNTVNLNVTGKLNEYLHLITNDLENSVEKFNTGILVFDALLSNYMSLAKSDNTFFRTNIVIDPTLIRINEYDLCVILGNLLDNSYEACKKQSEPKDIFVQIQTERGNLVIFVSNSILPDNTNYYEKKEDLIHGFGLKNVEKIADRYYGTFLTYIEQDRYNVVVTIPYDLKLSKVV